MRDLVDAHCHLADPELGAQLDEIMARAENAGVTQMIQGGVDPADWQRQLDLQKRFPGRILAVFGVHPWFVADHAVSDPSRIERALQELPSFLPSAVACGEMGLDFYPKRDPQSHSLQREVFERQLAIAREHGKPVVLHIVHAHSEAIEVLRRVGGEWNGIVHAFTGSAEIARQYINLGLTISVGGAVVREKGYETLKRAVAHLPADRLVVETDCPQPELGEPSALKDVAQAVARLRNSSPDEVLEQSRTNLARIFALSS